MPWIQSYKYPIVYRLVPGAINTRAYPLLGKGGISIRLLFTKDEPYELTGALEKTRFSAICQQEFLDDQ